LKLADRALVTDRKQLVQRLVDDVINADRPDLLDDLATTPVARTLRRAFGQFRAAFPDWRQDIVELVGEDPPSSPGSGARAPTSGHGEAWLPPAAP